MTVIGYARVSTTDQDLSIQKAALKAAPVVGALLAQEKNWDSAKEAAAVQDYARKITGFLQELQLSET